MYQIRLILSVLHPISGNLPAGFRRRNIVFSVPVTEVYLSYIGPDGSITRLPVVDPTVSQNTNRSLPSELPTIDLRQRQLSGLACVAVYDDVCAAASLPRLLRVTVGAFDVTSTFAMTTDSVRKAVGSPSAAVISSTVTTSKGNRVGGLPESGPVRFGTPRTAPPDGPSGYVGVVWDLGGTGVTDLDACRSTVTLRFVTAEPDPLYNRQVLQCVANANQSTVSSAAAATLNVKCESANVIVKFSKSLKVLYVNVCETC